MPPVIGAGRGTPSATYLMPDDLPQHPNILASPLLTPTPHILDQPVPLREPVQAIVPLAHGPHKPTQGVHLVLARVAAILVNFADGQLHRGVVLGFDDAAGGGAFAGDVAIGLGLVVGGGRGRTE